MRFSPYLLMRLRLRPEIQIEWVIRTYEQPDLRRVQADRREQLWKYIPEVGRYLRVIVLPDGKTILNAFFDRRFQ